MAVSQASACEKRFDPKGGQMDNGSPYLIPRDLDIASSRDVRDSQLAVIEGVGASVKLEMSEGGT